MNKWSIGGASMKKKALVIVNPSSGREKAKGYSEEVVRILKQQYESVDVRSTEKAGDATAFASEGVEDGYEAIIAMGGDGTVHEAVNGIAKHQERPHFGLIPMGTVNDLARVLGIPLDPEEAIRVLEDSVVMAVDIGKVNDRYFSNAIGIGSIPESIHDVSSEEKSRLGALAYYIAGAKRMADPERMEVTLEFDGYEWTGDISTIAVSLSGSLAGIRGIVPEANIQDGKLHILVVKDFGILDTLKMAPGILRGTITESDNVVYIQTEKIRIDAKGRELHANVDGEEGPLLPLEVEILPGYLEVLVSRELQKD
jgi:YegS/Rv2252/BmrU family lipid kinase